MRYDIGFICAALLCLLFGESLGIAMGIIQDFTLAPSHAHLNLVGWVTMAVCGLIHRAYPELAKSPLAPYQFWLALIGGFGLPAGIALALISGHTLILPAILFSFVVLTGTLLFAIMFVSKVARAKSAPA